MESRPKDFIRNAILEDIKSGKNNGRLHTRFPPEPNGYLHIGHAKAICLNFEVALEFEAGKCNLRFDDTNPMKEEHEFVEAIQEDIRWLGYDWADRLYFASDYYDRFYEQALKLIEEDKAYVDDLTAEKIREYRGTLTEPGKDSPYRTRTVEENLDLFKRMKNGEFEDGSRVLRAKIDMASGNINMRDPVLFRILRATHHRTGDDWCIYPMYDFAHPLSDVYEEITHSLCSLEFEDHRPLYDWVVQEAKGPGPRQIEFARLQLSHTMLSKRKLLKLIAEGVVTGWDDPRMPTLRGLRRRGYTPRAIRKFCDTVGMAKRDSTVEIALLEHCVREDLNLRSPRVMAVLDPVRVVIENYPEDQTEDLSAINNPEDPEAGSRMVPFSRVLYIERSDFQEDPPKKFFRLTPGREVRLRYAYFVTCVSVIKDETTGEIQEIRCTYDPQTRGGSAQDGRKVKATLHWVSAEAAVEAEVRIYDHLFLDETPPEDGDAGSGINPNSLMVKTGCRVEPSLAEALPGARFQFERLGYFCVDADSSAGHLVFNRTVALRDSWARMQQADKQRVG